MKWPANKLHVKFFLNSDDELFLLQKMTSMELFRSTLHKIDRNNITIEGYVTEDTLNEFKPKIRYRILGDVNKIIKNAIQYVSKTNRYKPKIY